MPAEWSDLRHFLAVARSGSTSAAARLLGTNQTTTARRIAALERALGVTLFERTAHGYSLTALGATLMAPAEAVERGAHAFTDQAEAGREGVLIRFTTSDWMAEHVAQPALTHFTQLHPGLRITLTVEERRTDLSGGDADVALRGAFSIDDPMLIARKVADTPWAFYCGVGHARAVGVPRTMDAALGSVLAVPSGHPEAVVRRLKPDARIGYSSNSTAALIEAIAAGGFVGPLPIWVGDARDDLQFCCLVENQLPSLWVLYPERLRRTAHIRAFADHIFRHARAWCRRQPKREVACPGGFEPPA